MQKILYYTVYGLLYGLSLLPLRLLYVLSDAIYLLIYHVVHSTPPAASCGKTCAAPSPIARRPTCGR